MKINVKKLLNFLVMFGTFAAVLIIAFSNSELTDAWGTLLTINPIWLFTGILGWVGYIFFDSVSLYRFFLKQGYPIPFYYAIYVTVIGSYYSNITPGASGGQPMQIYFLSKKGVPVGVGTSAATLRLFSMQFMIVATGFVLWLCNREAMAAQLGSVKWLIIVGGVINFSAVPLILLVSFYRPPVQALARFGIRLGAKIRLIKDPDRMLLRANDLLDTYHTSMVQVSKAPFQVVEQMLLMGLSWLSVLSVPVSVYYAFGFSDTPWYHILTISYMIFWSASYTLPPGGSGVQEGGFLVYYRGIFTSGTIGLALLVWRFITFYLGIFAGALLTLFWNFASKRKEKQSAESAEAVSADSPADQPADVLPADPQ